MSVAFADSGYWVALINPLDALRAVARRVSGDLGPKLRSSLAKWC